MKKTIRSVVVEEKSKIVLITKDVLRADYLSSYGNVHNITPNIDALARQGTIFRRHYTAAPSSAMSYTSMFSGLYPHELKRKTYSEVDPFDESETLFDIYENRGHKCHIIWDGVWFKTAYRHSKVYGKKTVYHNLDIQKGVGPHIKYEDSAPGDKELARQKILEELKLIDKNSEKYFIWIHLPHVLSGHTGYGSDIEMFDAIVGDVRSIVGDQGIYVSSDHGHMNMQRGIPVYGHHVYEGAIIIPFITPRIHNMREIVFPTSNTQLKEIMTNEHVEEKEYIYSDTQYYLQSNRKLAIIHEEYKYIYNKRDQSEELYNLRHDSEENVNLLAEYVYDQNRMVCYRISEIYYYPEETEIGTVISKFREARLRMWREGSPLHKGLYTVNNLRRNIRKYLLSWTERRKAYNGKWNAQVRSDQYIP